MVTLAVHGVSFRYPGGVAGLTGLDLEVVPGQTLAILGANGSGKTTLLLHLNGTLRPERGEIRIDDQPARYDRGSLNDWRSRVGLVLQDADDQLFAGTVAQDISFGPLNLGLTDTEAQQRIGEAIQAVAIGHLADRPIRMLSLGEKRRAAIAGVLAMRPQVLLLDEPTAGLDAEATAQMLISLQQLKASGATVVYATHDVDLAYAWSDRVVILEGGRLLKAGPPAITLADGHLLRRARLRQPMVLRVASCLQQHGLIRDGGPLPRTVDDLIGCITGEESLHPSAAAGSRTAPSPVISPVKSGKLV